MLQSRGERDGQIVAAAREQADKIVSDRRGMLLCWKRTFGLRRNSLGGQIHKRWHLFTARR